MECFNDFQLSQMKDWYRETNVVNQKSPRLFHDASLSNGTAENRAVCPGLKAHGYNGLAIVLNQTITTLH